MIYPVLCGSSCQKISEPDKASLTTSNKTSFWSGVDGGWGMGDEMRDGGMVDGVWDEEWGEE